MIVLARIASLVFSGFSTELHENKNGIKVNNRQWLSRYLCKNVVHMQPILIPRVLNTKALSWLLVFGTAAQGTL